jgi:hypothetical protein
MMGMMPGMGKMRNSSKRRASTTILKRQIALIQSMTRKERANPAEEADCGLRGRPQPQECRIARRAAARHWRAAWAAARAVPPDGARRRRLNKLGSRCGPPDAPV